MSLSTQFRTALSQSAGQRNAAVDCVDGRRTARLRFDDCNALAAAVAELTLETPELSAASPADLKRLSDSLSRRLTYLLEPIAPIEVDAQECFVQLRSTPPAKDDDGRRYYELIVRRGGAIVLVRYEKSPGQPRIRVPAALTHEVIGRLVGDFAAVLDEL